MTAALDALADRILGSMRAMYGAPPRRSRVDEAGFAHLDLGAYRRLRSELEAQGFVYLVDMALAQINESATTLMMPTMVRSFCSADGTVVASYYQVRPRWGRLLATVGKGFRNGRVVGPLKLFLRQARTRHFVEFSTALSDGRFLSSSNAAAAEKIGMPPELQRRFLPAGTPWPAVQADHRDHLARALSTPGVRPLLSRSADDLEAHFDRESAIKRTHRERIGWVTRDELRAFGVANPGVADEIIARIRLKLGAGGASPDGTMEQGVVARRGDAAND